MKLEGKTALITGSGRGIGKGCAIELARNGATVMVNDRPASPDLQTCVTEIEAIGGQAIPIEADVFSREGCEQLLQEALKQVGSIDILVSNPAYNVRQPFLEFDPDVFEQVIRGTLTAGFHMSQLVARHMVATGKQGKIIFISSVHARMPYQTAVAYNAAKAGLNQMAKTIARELIDYKINVNIIEPGWIDTPKEHETFGDEFFIQTAPTLPWKRFGTPEDIGKGVVFLASEDSDYMTGTILRMDGGYIHKDA